MWRSVSEGIYLQRQETSQNESHTIYVCLTETRGKFGNPSSFPPRPNTRAFACTLVPENLPAHLKRYSTAEVEKHQSASFPHALVGVFHKSEDESKRSLLKDRRVVLLSSDHTEIHIFERSYTRVKNVGAGGRGGEGE